MSHNSTSYTPPSTQTTSQNPNYTQAPPTVPNSQSSQPYTYNSQSTTLTASNYYQQAPPTSSETANQSAVLPLVQTYDYNTSSHTGGGGGISSGGGSRVRKLSSSSSKGSRSLSNSATGRSLAEVNLNVISSSSLPTMCYQVCPPS